MGNSFDKNIRAYFIVAVNAYDYVCPTGTIGVSVYAAKNLGDVVYVELPTLDQEVNAGDSIGAVESVKSASDIMTPVSGKIIEANDVLEEKPGTINKGPESEGWIARIEVKDAAEISELMGDVEYGQFTAEWSAAVVWKFNNKEGDPEMWVSTSDLLAKGRVDGSFPLPNGEDQNHRWDPGLPVRLESRLRVVFGEKTRNISGDASHKYCFTTRIVEIYGDPRSLFHLFLLIVFTHYHCQLHWLLGPEKSWSMLSGFWLFSRSYLSTCHKCRSTSFIGMRLCAQILSGSHVFMVHGNRSSRTNKHKHSFSTDRNLYSHVSILLRISLSDRVSLGWWTRKLIYEIWLIISDQSKGIWGTERSQ